MGHELSLRSRIVLGLTWSGLVLLIYYKFIVSLVMLDYVLIDLILEKRIKVLLDKTCKSLKDQRIGGDCRVALGLFPDGEDKGTKHLQVIFHQFKQVLLITIQE